MMKHSVMIVVLSVTVATGIMAKNEKSETTKAEAAASAAADKNDKSVEEKKAQTIKTLERIKEKNLTLYKALMELKKNNKAAFEVELGRILEKYHAEEVKGREGKRGKERGHHDHKPRPYQNQLDRLPDRRHTGDDRER